MSPLVSIVIVNFNSGEHIFRCLDHVFRQTYPSLEVIVVENAADDGSGEKLTHIAAEGKIRYLREGRNVGFAKANNDAFRVANGQYLLALNADAFLQPDYVERCVTAMKQDSSVGIVGGKLVSARDPGIIDSAGVLLFEEGVAVERGIGQPDSPCFNQQEFVFGVCAAAALYRREMLDQVVYQGEFFDENFLAFCEDVDLCARSIIAGWRTLYLPAAVAHHVRGGSTSNSRFARYLVYRNTLYFQQSSFVAPSLRARVLQVALRLIRFITIPVTFQAKARSELVRERKRLREKRAHVLRTAAGRTLVPACSGSYIVYELQRRQRRLRRNS